MQVLSKKKEKIQTIFYRVKSYGLYSYPPQPLYPGPFISSKVFIGNNPVFSFSIHLNMDK